MHSVALCKLYVGLSTLLVISLLTLRLPVMLNDHNMYEHILEDNIFSGVVGMLECAFLFLSSSYITH